MSKKAIAVIGATGAQGGGLMRAILADRSDIFSCRAITRDPSKLSREVLAGSSQNFEVMRGDLDDPESLKRAFDGAHGVFAMTNYWEHRSAQRELEQAKNIATAAMAAGVAHVVWSTLEDTRPFTSNVSNLRASMPMLQGKYRVPHFDAKAEASAYFGRIPTTYMYTAFFWENFLSYFIPKQGENGNYTITLPMGISLLAGIASEDVGRCAFGFFAHDSGFINSHRGIAGEFLTLREIAERMSAALGVTVHYEDMDPDAFRAQGFQGAAELGNMFQVYRDFEREIVGNRDGDLTRRMNPDTLSFNRWLKLNVGKLRAAMMLARVPATAGV